MIKLHYNDESGKLITFNLIDWEAVIQCANDLVRAPIDLDYVYFDDENGNSGIFNLHTFEIC